MNIRLNNNSLDNKYIMYLLIALTVIIFNITAVVGFDALLHDDPTHYNEFVEGKFYFDKMKYNLLSPFKCLFQWAIAYYSPHLMRGLLVLLLMVPVSCCFYYLYYNKFGFPRMAAFAAAVLPNILPSQFGIPAGINMSYSLYGLLFALLSLMSGFSYLESTTSRDWSRLVKAIVLYFICTQLMEQSIFFFPPLALAFLGYTKLSKKHAWLISSFFVVTMAKFIWVVSNPRKGVFTSSLPEIFRRIGRYFKWSFPSPGTEPLFLVIIFAGIILAGFILVMKRSGSGLRIAAHFRHLAQKGYVLYLYAFLICWAISTAAVFILFSEVYQTRYVHISSFAFAALLVLAIHVILNRKIGKLKLNTIVLIALIVFSGVLRYERLNEIFTPANKTRSLLIRDLGKVSFPENSQVVVTGVSSVETGHPGGWNRSCGYLKFILKRKDINGLVGAADTGRFAIHFNPKRQSKGKMFLMSGLSPGKPTFFFRMNREKKELEQLRYALEWRGKTKNAGWTIFRVDMTGGRISPFISGSGMEDYLSKVKELEGKGIPPDRILWGGLPTKEDLERLENDELSPKLLLGELINQFEVVEPAKAKLVKEISGVTDNLAEGVRFGNKFVLVSSFKDEATTGRNREKKLVYFFLKNLREQRTGHYRAVIMLKNDKTKKVTWRKNIPIGNKDRKIAAGDFILGCVIIPEEKLQQAESSGIRFLRFSIAVKKASKPRYAGLRIRTGKHEVEGKSTLLLPIEKLL